MSSSFSVPVFGDGVPNMNAIFMRGSEALDLPLPTCGLQLRSRRESVTYTLPPSPDCSGVLESGDSLRHSDRIAQRVVAAVDLLRNEHEELLDYEFNVLPSPPTTTTSSLSPDSLSTSPVSLGVDGSAFIASRRDVAMNVRQMRYGDSLPRMPEQLASLEVDDWEKRIRWSSDQRRAVSVSDAPSSVQYHNRDLDEGAWVDSITWNKADGDHDMRERHPLILDLNDTSVLFVGDDNIERNAGDGRGEEDDEEESSSDEEGGRRDTTSGAWKRASNDRYYRNNRTVQQLPNLRHAIPAQTLLSDWYVPVGALSAAELRNWHRPKLYVQEKEDSSAVGGFQVVVGVKDTTKVPIKCKTTQEVQLGIDLANVASNTDIGMGMRVPEAVDDMSALTGNIICLEYAEEFPMLLSNLGMASSIVTYVRESTKKRRVGGLHERVVMDVASRRSHGAQGSEIGASWMTELGSTQLLGPDEPSPLDYGEVTPDRPVTVLLTNFFAAPIFRHKVTATDFLLVRKPDSKTWLMREIPALYTVGQLQPRVEIPNIATDAFVDLLRSSVQAKVFRMLNNGPEGEDVYLYVSDLMNVFRVERAFATGILKKVCKKDLADKHGDRYTRSGRKVPGEDQIKRLCPPEYFCLMQSAAAAKQRLVDAGIVLLASVPPGNIAKMLEKLRDPLIRRAALYIERLLMMTPWHLSTQFLEADPYHGRMPLIKGSFHGMLPGCGFSYGYSPSYKQKHVTDKLEKKAAEERAPLTRKKGPTLREAVQKLTAYSKETLKSFKQLQLMRILRSEIKKLRDKGVAVDESILRLAKLTGVSTVNKIKSFQLASEQIFQKQCDALASEVPPLVKDPDLLRDDASDLDVSDVEDDVERDEAERKREAAAEERKHRSRDEEAKEMQALLSEVGRSGSMSASGSPLIHPGSGTPDLLRAPSPSPRASSSRERSPARMDVSPELADGAFRRPQFRRNRVRKVKITVLKRILTVTKPDGSTEDIVTNVFKESEYPQMIADFKACQESGDHFFVDSNIRNMLDKADEEKKLVSGKKKRKQKTKPKSKAVTQKSQAAQEMAVQQPNVSPVVVETSEDSMALTFDTSALLVSQVQERLARMEQEQQQKGKQKPGRRKGVAAGGRKRKSIQDVQILDAVPPEVKKTRRVGGNPTIRLQEMLRASIAPLKAARVGKNIMKFGLFMAPVSKKELPNYYTVISSPMDLQTVERKIDRGEYKSLSAFLEDIDLISKNAKLYNGEAHPIALLAEELVETVSGYFRGVPERMKVLAEIMKDMKKKQLVEIVDTAIGRREYTLFKQPVDKKKVPTYYTRIAEPMDLRTLKNTINKREYPLENFRSDAMLIYTNCRDFNTEASPLTQTAKALVTELIMSAEDAGILPKS